MISIATGPFGLGISLFKLTLFLPNLLLIFLRQMPGITGLLIAIFSLNYGGWIFRPMDGRELAIREFPLVWSANEFVGRLSIIDRFFHLAFSDQPMALHIAAPADSTERVPVFRIIS